MTLELVEIPGFEPRFETRWKVRALVVNGRDRVRAALSSWARNSPHDYRAIMKVIRLAAQQRHVLNPKHVKKCGNPRHGDVYEMLAYTGAARLLFFYDEGEQALIICTNEHEKGRGEQDAAFAQCAELKQVYLTHKQNEFQTRTKRVVSGLAGLSGNDPSRERTELGGPARGREKT